ncbi:MAG: alpha-(1-_3)-arabinofuranosyltransferase [Acidimicrobiales bacterium]
MDRRGVVPVVLAVVSYLPLLFTHPGKIGADTKQYLYLDPGRLLGRALSMWEPNVGMGTVTHQNIGYLLPMGPWYWALRTLGLPTWIAQRLWTGTLLFLAGLGVVFLLRALSPEPAQTGKGSQARREEERSERGHFGGLALVVAGLAYSLSPYVLEYEARISAILMPWSAMPWLVALVIRSLRRGGWRDPALFALVVALCGGVNATSLIYVGIAPILWIPHAVWGLREVSLRRALAAVGRIGVLTVAASLWWMAGLLTQAGYGLDVLRYTETVKVVARTGTPIEVLRGLGNWYFYGRDTIAPWVQPANEYTQELWRIAVSLALPICALGATVSVRWRHKIYFVSLIAVGMAIAVGVHPYAHPSPLGGVFKAIANSSSAGLALRSVGRAVPLVALGTAVLLGAGIEALRVSRPRLSTAAGAVCLLLVVLDMAPLFTGQFVDDSLQRPERLPSYVTDAVHALDAGPHDTRILELPGADFSHLRWGTTLDPVIPGLTDRPYVGRELIPYGSAASADLLRALDETLQEGVFEPSSVAPIARLMNVGDIVLRSDLQYERFRTPRPRPTWEQFSAPTPVGLRPPRPFGPMVAERPVIPLTDEISLATPPSAPDPPAMAIFGVDDTAPIVHLETTTSPLLVAGDGQGLVHAAGAGILDDRTGPVLYAGTMARDPAAMRRALADGADLLVTDTNRRRGQRWGTIRANNGYTEQAGETPLVADPTDARLPLFPGATDSSATVTEQRGVASVRATDYGNPVSYDAAHRPSQALDGDPTTAWTEGAFSDVTGAKLRIDLMSPVTTDHIGLVQPLLKPNERWITKATLIFDGVPGATVVLGPESRTTGGQRVTFPSRTFRRLEIRVDDSNIGRRADYRGGSGVGFAEVQIPGVKLDEMLRLPTDLLDAAGTSAVDHRLQILLDRVRAQPLESFVTDPELAIRRTFTLPGPRSFALRGTARLESAASDAQVDAALGRSTSSTVTTVTSGGHLPGALGSRAAAAVDGDPSTAWQTEFGDQEGNFIELHSPTSFNADHLDLRIVADGRHSVPTDIEVRVDGGPAQRLRLPTVADETEPNASTLVRVPMLPVSGTTLRVTIVGVREVRTVNYFSQVKQPLPMAIAELVVPGISPPPMPASTLPATCRSDLLVIDGATVPLLVSGRTSDAQRGAGLDVSLCPGTPAIRLGSGPHDVRATPGRDSGIDLDRLLFASDRGGSPLLRGPLASSGPEATTAGPAVGAQLLVRSDPHPAVDAGTVTVVRKGTTSMRLRVTPPVTGESWLVLGQSNNRGWKATVRRDSRRAAVGLGSSALVDGYANGWIIPASLGRTPLTIDLVWTPQRTVNMALVASGIALVLCLLVGLTPVRRRTSGWAIQSDGASLPRHPEAWSPLRSAGRPLSRRTAFVVVVVAGAISAVVIGPWAGLGVAVPVAAAVARPRWRGLLSVGALALLGGCAIYVLQLQYRYRFPAKIEWPDHFDRIALLPWIAAAWVVADTVVDLLRSRRRRSRSSGSAHPIGPPEVRR